MYDLSLNAPLSDEHSANLNFVAVERIDMPDIEPLPPGFEDAPDEDDELVRYVGITTNIENAMKHVCAVLKCAPIPMLVCPPPSRTPAAASPRRNPPVIIWPDNAVWERNISIDDLPAVAVMVIAHEVRHLYEENWRIADPLKRELDSDRFAGRVCCKLRLNQDALTRLVERLPGYPLHPPGSERAREFMRGWMEQAAWLLAQT